MHIFGNLTSISVPSLKIPVERIITYFDLFVKGKFKFFIKNEQVTIYLLPNASLTANYNIIGFSD